MGMHASLMGIFSFPTPILMIGSSFGEASTSMRSVSFCTSHMEDPWILHAPNTSSEPIVTDMPFPASMVAYKANIECVANPSPSSSRMGEEDPYVFPAWVVESSHTHDCLDSVFPSDETIIKAMLGVEPPWEEIHHRSYFLLELDRLEHEDFREVLSERIGSPMVPLSSLGLMDDGNMENIYSMIPINIARDPGRIENVYIGAECSHAEIQEYIELFK